MDGLFGGRGGGTMRMGGIEKRTDVVGWLLVPDPANPGARYWALRDLLGRPEDDPELVQAQADVMAHGPVPAILDAQYPDGYWVKPGGAISPSYRSTLWQVIFLAEFGADPQDERVRQAYAYLLDNGQAANGGFSISERPVPSSALLCSHGDLLWALLQMGWAGDERVQAALDWLVAAVTGEGEIRYYKSGTSAPGFCCGANQGQSCAWGATKILKALATVPPDQRTGPVKQAIDAGVGFLLSRDPTVADYPYTERVNSTWFKFGFPLSYRSDVLETTAVLVAFGHGDDPRLANALRFIQGKADSQGRWPMEQSFNGKMWADIEAKGAPSKWVTLRALRVLGSPRGAKAPTTNLSLS